MYLVMASMEVPVRSFSAMMAALQISPYLGPSTFAAGFDILMSVLWIKG